MIADSITPNRVAEVACEFNARECVPSHLYTKAAPKARRIFDHPRKTTFATVSPISCHWKRTGNRSKNAKNDISRCPGRPFCSRSTANSVTDLPIGLLQRGRGRSKALRLAFAG